MGLVASVSEAGFQPSFAYLRVGAAVILGPARPLIFPAFMFRPADSEFDTDNAGTPGPSQTLPQTMRAVVARATLGWQGSGGSQIGSVGTDPKPTEKTDSAPKTAYGREFWLSYAALTTLMVAVSLMYRFADFVTFLGGSELDLGAIVGVGMVGSLAMRLACRAFRSHAPDSRRTTHGAAM